MSLAVHLFHRQRSGSGSDHKPPALPASETGISFRIRPHRLSLESMVVMSMQKISSREPKDGSR